MTRLVALWIVGLTLLAAAPAAAQAPAQVIVRDVEMGEGDTAVDGARVVVQYTAYLSDGTKFDSTYDRGRPFDFTLGFGQVIRGMDLGLKGMRVGGRRELIVPPSLAYGDKGAGTAVPPGETLRYEIELMKVEATSYAVLDADALHGLLGTAIKIVDIRTDTRRAATGTIAGALGLPAFDEKGVLNRHFLARLLDAAGKSDALVLIDDDGRQARFLGTFLTQNAGFTNMRGLDGGLKAWTGKGFALKK